MGMVANSQAMDFHQSTLGTVVARTSIHRLDKKNCLHGHRVKENPQLHSETALP